MIDRNFTIFILSFFLNLIFTRFFFFKADKLLLVDFPSIRKLHSSSVPSISGLAMFLTLLFSVIYFFDDLSIRANNQNDILIFAISILFIFIIGLIDDSFKISTFKKIFLQLFISTVSIFTLELYKISLIPIIDNYIFNFIIEMFFILGILNSINLIDGIDNLAGSISIVICSSFIMMAHLIGYDTILFFYMIAGCLFSYLIYNNFIGRVFMGDSGSLLLGWVFAITPFYFMKHSSDFSIHISLLILAIPAFDVLYVMIFRFIKRKDTNFLLRVKGMFLPTHSHIHHSLENYGYSNIRICLIICFFSTVCSFIGFIVFINLSDYLERLIVVICMLAIFSIIRFKVDKYV